MRNYNIFAKRCTTWLKHQIKNAGAKGIIIGLSGGIDSAVVAVLSKKAFGKSVLALNLPCVSSNHDLNDARLITQTFRIKTRTFDLSKIFNTLIKSLPLADQNTRANLKPRLRMMILYYFANQLNYLVAGTGNKSELMTGYFTKHGDGGVDLLPLGGLLKTEVKELAHYLKIPARIINKPPSAGLWSGQTDEGEMGIKYHELDAILNGPTKFRTKRDKVKQLIKNSAHKRQLPKIFIP